MTFPERDKVDLDAAEQAVRLLLYALGEDPEREGLRETPRRVAKFYGEWLDRRAVEFTSFASEGMDELVVQRGIPFFSLCEHHMLPFFGTATVGYLPNGRIIGLSKLARAVRVSSECLQNQERITMRVADLLEKELSPRGVGVVLRARHLCMEMRGVRAHGTETVTSRLRGVLLEDQRARAEFLSLAGEGG
jgi:GTP cyclohydrolase I